MLVTFKTDVGNITMFGNDALQMIKMMGHSETVPGAILADEVPQALSRLKAALRKEQNVAPSDEDDDENEPVVSTAHRGLPLVNLLTDAVAAGCNVMWE
ncbi:protein of unknown function [Nitrosomonas marina]|uniref:DUF1840 domain-containing protein n=2 Tax=Nitrosomonas marina TaxID=917 RepID=A0A1H8HF08_9PROT|nr:DUF1840 domain-containing protein [Nitrosomonas marina]SEN54842.1 protein of unknown function [Nitrosomonas marina]